MPNLRYNFISDVIGYEGQIITNRPTVTRSVYNKTGSILPFGRPVVYSGNNKEVRLPNTNDEKVIGISILSRLYEDAVNSQGDSGYPTDESVLILVEGDILVRTESVINFGDRPYFRHTANGTGKLVIGRFRDTADNISSTASCDLLPNASFFPIFERPDSTVIAKAGELVGLSIKLI
jgi:hypothetical protein